MDVNYETLQAYGKRKYGKDLVGAVKEASGLNQEINGVCRTLFGKETNQCMVELTTLLGGNGAFLPGVAGSYWETPDVAGLRIIGDLDVRAEILEVNPTGTNRTILSKYNPTTNQAYEWRYNGFGFDEFVWSTTGANVLTDTSSQFGAGLIRFTIDVVNAANRVLTWWYGITNDISAADVGWAVRQQKTVAGNTSIFAGTAPLRIGARSDAAGNNPFSGRLGRVQLRDGLNGTIVANPDFRSLAPGLTNFVDSTGKTWTRAGTATVS